MRRLLIVSLLAILSGGLAGCAVADLAAYTVKAVEKNQRDGGSPGTSPPVSPPPSAPAQAAIDPAAESAPPPPSAPAPRRGSITAEELPPG